MHIYYHPTYNAGRNDSETTRKSAHLAESLKTDPIPGVTVTSPMQFATEAEELARIAHSPEYLEAVRTGNPADLARSNGLAWCPDVYRMAIAHSAGMVAAVDTAISGSTTAGSASSGLHHASRLSGMGFCTINGIAVAVLAALARGAENVLVLDVDAHCGGGTYDILSGNPGFVQVDVSTSFTYDRFPAEAPHRRIPARAGDYLERIAEAIEYAGSLPRPDFIVVNAGVDPINDGVDVADIARRERMVRDFVGSTPAAFAIAGGYGWGGHSYDDIVSWHRLTVAEWARR